MHYPKALLLVGGFMKFTFSNNNNNNNQHDWHSREVQVEFGKLRNGGIFSTIVYPLL